MGVHSHQAPRSDRRGPMLRDDLEPFGRVLSSCCSSAHETEGRRGVSMNHVCAEFSINTHNEGMEIAPLPVACEVARRSLFGRVYIFVEEGSQRVCLIRVFDIMRWFRHRDVRRCNQNRRRTFGIGRNMVGTTSAGTYKSGTSSSSGSLSSDGGGGTSL